MTNNPNKTITSAAAQTPPSLVMKIDNITYRVWAHFSETSTETMEDKIKRMLRAEVRRTMENE